MSLNPSELAQLAVTFPQEHAEQINAKSAKYGVPRADGSQDVSLLILAKGPDFDPMKGTFPQFIFGHWEKQMRRQLGAHTFAVSLDRDDILGEEARAQIGNMVSLNGGDPEEAPSLSGRTDVAKILSVARLVSGKSSSDLARRFGVTPRRVRQMLQQIREKKTIPKLFELCLDEAR